MKTTSANITLLSEKKIALKTLRAEIATLRVAVKTDRAIAKQAKENVKFDKAAAREVKRVAAIAKAEARLEKLKSKGTKPVGVKAMKAARKAGPVTVMKLEELQAA